MITIQEAFWGGFIFCFIFEALVGTIWWVMQNIRIVRVAKGDSKK